MIERRKLFGGLGNMMFQYAFLYSLLLDGKIPNIYLQSEKFFFKHRGKIKELYGRGIGHIDKVSIHIRRGDYINNPFYVDLTTTDYYQKAIAHFPDDKFLIFCADRQPGSDDTTDKSWAMDFINTLGIGDRSEMFTGDSEIDDMNAMASCKAHIMANSSFSWWASYLGHGKVIAPKDWYSDGRQRTELLRSWTII